MVQNLKESLHFRQKRKADVAYSVTPPFEKKHVFPFAFANPFDHDAASVLKETSTVLVYSALASEPMFRHFKTTRDAIAAQVKATKNAVGEKDLIAPGNTKGLDHLIKHLANEEFFNI